MWGKIVTEATFETNFNTQFPNTKTDVLIHLAQWQYWWWFWFSFLWVLYYLFLARTLRFRTLKFRPKIVSSFRPHGKWGDLIICILPVSWCANILINSNFLLKLLEWQAESSLFTIRIRGKQWYWVYKFDFKNFSDIISTPKNVGNNKWMFSFFGDLKTSDNYLHIIQMRAQNKWIKKYWTKNLSKFEQEEKNNINFIHDFFKIDNTDTSNNHIGFKKENSTFMLEKSSLSLLQQNYDNISMTKKLTKSYLNIFNEKTGNTSESEFLIRALTNSPFSKAVEKWLIKSNELRDFSISNKKTGNIIKVGYPTKESIKQLFTGRAKEWITKLNKSNDLNTFNKKTGNIIKVEYPTKESIKQLFTGRNSNIFNKKTGNIIKVEYPTKESIKQLFTGRNSNIFNKKTDNIIKVEYPNKESIKQLFTGRFDKRLSKIVRSNNSCKDITYSTQELFKKKNFLHSKPNTFIASFSKKVLRFDILFTKTIITKIKDRNSFISLKTISPASTPVTINSLKATIGVHSTITRNLSVKPKRSLRANSFVTRSNNNKAFKDFGVAFMNHFARILSDQLEKEKRIDAMMIPNKNAKYNPEYFNKTIIKSKLIKLKKNFNSFKPSNTESLTLTNVNGIKSIFKNFETIPENLLYSGLLENDASDIKFAKYNYKTFSVAEESNRVTKQLFGKTQPVILVKVPVANSLLQTSNLNLFKFRFFDQNSTVSTRNMVKVPYFVFKQVRYKRRKLAFATSHILTDTLGNEKTIKKNFSLNNQYSIEQDVKNPARYYRMFKKNRFRGENMPIVVAKRLLRVKRTLVIPTHINITAITNSYDVVHSWFIPGLGLKMDCVPGRSTHHTFYVDNAGFYYGQCAEICGRYHHHMPIRVCALPFEHFLVWWHSIGLPKLMYPNKKHNMLKNYTIRKFVW